MLKKNQCSLYLINIAVNASTINTACAVCKCFMPIIVTYTGLESISTEEFHTLRWHIGLHTIPNS